MKSKAEIKDAHDLLCAIISGHLPINMSAKDHRLLEAQHQVLCFVLECESNDCFKNSIDSLKDLIGHIRFHEHGRRFKSLALVE